MAKQTHLRIIGMTCGACVGRVEGALLRVDGVAQAVVNLMSESATVTKQDESFPNTSLIAAVQAAGYDAEVMADARQLVDQISGDTHLREKLRRHRQAMFQAVGLAIPIVALQYLMPVLWGTTPEKQIAGRLMQLVLLIMLAISPGGGPILAGGLRAMWHRVGNMDLLITMGVLVAFFSSLYGIFIAHSNEFIHLHAAAMILALICVGRYLEVRAKGRASQAMSSLARRAPRNALVRRGDEWKSTPVKEIQVDDSIKVPAHEPVPVDGEVTEGRALVDESLMTGEAMPVQRGVGDAVLGGTAVTEGMLVVRATAVGSRSALGRIVQLVQNAQASRTQSQRLADRAAAIFTPVVMSIALIVFIGWMLAKGGSVGAAGAARSAVAVLVVACPCALGLATPTVVLVASGIAALRGILVRDAGMLEAMGQIDVIVWDKTGTLTAGSPTVRTWAVVDGANQQEILNLAAGAEQFSNHPLAAAIVAHARQHDAEIIEPDAFESVIGAGVRATMDGRNVLIGKPAFLLDRGVDTSPLLTLIEGEPQSESIENSRNDPAASSSSQIDTIVAMAVDGRSVGVFKLADAIRPSSADALARLRRLGIRCEMLTGDAEPVAQSIGRRLQIEENCIHAAVDPAGKVARIDELKKQGLRVAMVGDGVNDAAALAVADVGIAFATGAEVAGEAAGINLIGSTPHLVADAVQLARGSLRVIRQNLFWAFFYNILMIPLAALGILPPAFAAGAMMVSSLTVVTNAIRLPRVVRWSKSHP